MPKEMKIEAVHALGIETNGRFSYCTLFPDDIKNRIARGDKNPLKVNGKGMDPGSRDKTYKEAIIPIEEYMCLKDEDLTRLGPATTVINYIIPESLKS